MYRFNRVPKERARVFFCTAGDWVNTNFANICDFESSSTFSVNVLY